MTNFVETEETKQQLLIYKNKASVLEEQIRSAERLISALKKELQLLNIFIEDYDDLKLLWSE